VFWLAGALVPHYGTGMWIHDEPHPGAFLRQRFLLPLGLSASDLASRCGMPRSRVSEILAGKRAITADTAQRLGALFRMAPEHWLALQADHDLHRAPRHTAIVPLDPPGVLIGPLGVTRLPTTPLKRPVLVAPQATVRALAAEASSPHYAAQRTPTTHHEVTYEDGTRALIADRS